MDFGKLYLNRSQSVPDINYTPLCRRVHVQEIYRDLQSNSTLTRNIRCEEVYETDCQSNTFNSQTPGSTSQIELGSGRVRPFIWNSEFQKGFLAINTTLTQCDSSDNVDIPEETPMEVDYSSDSVLYNSNSDDLPSKAESHNFRRRQIRNIRKSALPRNTTSETDSTLIPISEPSVSKFSSALVILITVLTAVGVYIVIMGDRYIYVNRHVQLENIKHELQQNVLHQDDVIKVITRSFEQMDMWRDQIKILPFVGTTGVGKTFTANIIKKHFYPKLVHETSSNLLASVEKQQAVIESLNSCCCNLIIVDNLKACDLNDFLQFVAKLPKSQTVLIIPVFNIQDTVDGVVYKINKDDFKLIREKFDKSELHHEIALFAELEYRVIEGWLRQELHKRQVEEGRHNTLVKFLLSNNHVKYKGFKGLDSKLSLALDRTL